MTERPGRPPLALYVHLPWCVRKCPYCDFNSFEAAAELPVRAYIDALLRDLGAEAALVGERGISSVFIGGGTPSLFSGESIKRLLGGVRGLTDLGPATEITLEANPGALDRRHFDGYLEAGVNRLSVGAQSFRDAQLQRLGRIHGAGDTARAVAQARAAGFDNINVDLMHGLPGDRVGDSVADVSCALALNTEHISWYELTIEPGTVFGRRPPVLPDEDLIAAGYAAGHALLRAAGFDQYEISAYARTGRAARHNLNYWTFGDYLGIGAGAHSKLTRGDGIYREVRRNHPGAYMGAAGTAACRSVVTRLTATELCTEFMLNVLRLRHGFAPALFEDRTGLPLSHVAEALDEAVQRGWLTRDAGRIRPTTQGLRFLNDVQLLFVPVPVAAAG